MCKVLQAKQISEIKQKNLEREVAKMKSVMLPSKLTTWTKDEDIRPLRCLFCAKQLDKRAGRNKTKGCHNVCIKVSIAICMIV